MPVNTVQSIKSVQRLVVTIGSGALSATGTISSVDTSKCSVDVIGHSTTSTSFASGTAYAELTNATTVTATRLSSTNQVDITIQVTEYI